MSSILKALKKVDETSGPPDDRHQWPHPGAVEETLTRNIKRRWLLKRALTCLLLAVFLVGLAVLFYLRPGKQGSQEPDTPRKRADLRGAEQVHRSKIAQTPTAGRRPGVAGTGGSAGAAKGAPGEKTPPDDKQINPAGRSRSPERTSANARVGQRLPEARKPLPKISKKAATKAAAAPLTEEGEAGPAAVSTAGSQAPPSPEEQVQYSRLKKTDLILQAIAWSPVPAERIAVVNGSIVREGDSVSGYVLMRIRQDDIVLNDGAKSWQLDFSLQQ